MRTKLIIALILFWLSAGAAQASANDLGLVRLSLIEGDVQVLIQDTTDWTAAAINLPMNERDRLWIPGSGRAELQVQGGVYARAQGNTALDLLTVDRDSIQFYLDQGHLYINNRTGGIDTVQVDTRLTSIRSYDDTIMMMDVSDDGVTEISVLQGTAYAESRAGATRVDAGSTLTIREEDSADLSPVSPPDEWEQWNRERDSRVSASSGESSRYLPEELHEYASDFDQNGQWDYVSDYGYVWSPGIAAPGWAPYSYGSWVWIRGSYVWISYDPWGWAPSHYGRWAFVGSRWRWVPPSAGAVYWGPGYVGWVVTPTYVAWVPLAPGEIYYGYGYYGPGSVNITTVNINTVVINRSYRNARFNNSVVVERRDAFGTGRRAPIKVDRNPFEERHRDRNVHVVPPRERPERAVVIAPPESRGYTRRALQERERLRIEQPGRTVVPGTPDNRAEERKRIEQPGRTVVPGTPRADTRAQERRERIRQPAPAPRAITPPAPQSQPSQQPPERVRRTRPENLKNERPMVREQKGSVFMSRPPGDLPVTRSQEPRVIKRRPAPAPAPAAGPALDQRPQQQRGGQEQPRKSMEDRRMRR
jgi:hypothetical protein